MSVSKWPDLRVSLPQDQPTRYFDSGLSRDSRESVRFYVFMLEEGLFGGRGVCVPSSVSGRAARYEALERTCARSWVKRSGRSLTMMMPREDGPKASVSVSKETVPVHIVSSCSSQFEEESYHSRDP